MPSRCVPPWAGGMMVPAAVIVPGWQAMQPVRLASASVGCGAAGGSVWQVPQVACEGPPVHCGVAEPWQATLLHVAAVRSQAGVTPAFTALPAKLTRAVGWSMWKASSASRGFTWQSSQSKGGEMALPLTCAPCAPTRTGSAVLPQVARGGAPVPFVRSPWHMVQFFVQVVTPAGRSASWQVRQATLAGPPSRALPWQALQFASPLLAFRAWKPGSVWTIHAGGCARSFTAPVVCCPWSWQARQSPAPGSGTPRGGWGGGSVLGVWHAVQSSGPGVSQVTGCAGLPSGEWQATVQVVGPPADT